MFMILSLIGVLSASATFLNAKEHPDYPKIESNPYGKKILDTISLQVSSEKAPEEVMLLLDDLSGKLMDEQRRDNQLNATREGDCRAEIEFLDRPIEFMHFEIERALQIITEKKPLYDDTIAKRDTKDSEIKFFELQIQLLDRTFKSNSEKFQKSHQEHDEALRAIVNSLEYMNKIHLDQQKQSVKSNNEHMEGIPLDVLLQVGHNQDSILKLIHIAEDLKVDYQESIDAVLDRKLQAENDYHELRKSIEMILADLKEVREELNKHALDLSEDLEESRRMERETKEECGSMERAQQDKIVQCGAWAKQYLSEKAKRSEELQIIRDIQKLYSE